MAAMPIYGKNCLKLIIWNQESFAYSIKVTKFVQTMILGWPLTF